MGPPALWAPVHRTSHTHIIGDGTRSSVLIRSHCLTSLRLIIYFPFYIRHFISTVDVKRFSCLSASTDCRRHISYFLRQLPVQVILLFTYSIESLCDSRLQGRWTLTVFSYSKKEHTFLSESAPVPK